MLLRLRVSEGFSCARTFETAKIEKDLLTGCCVVGLGEPSKSLGHDIRVVKFFETRLRQLAKTQLRSKSANEVADLSVCVQEVFAPVRVVLELSRYNTITATRSKF